MRKIFLTTAGLVMFSLALGLPFGVLAVTLTFDAETVLSLPSGTIIYIPDGGLVGEIVINNNSTLTVTTESDTIIGFRSPDKYNFTATVNSGTATITEICAAHYSQVSIVATAAATITVTVDSTTACDASSSDPPATILGGGPGSGGGSSSAGIGSSTLVVNINETMVVSNFASGGTNLFMYINSQIDFNTAISSGGQGSHSARVTEVDLANSIVTIVFESNPITIELGVGETKNVDLDGDGISDVQVKFNGLTVNKADLTFTTIAVVEGSGNLVKLECEAGADINDPCKAVYYLGNDGKRYVFPNVKTYDTWYDDFSTVETISSEDLAKYPIGGNVTYRPGVKLVKIQTDPKVYAVSTNGALRWVSTGEIAEELYGSGWATTVEDIPDAFFVNYTIGVDIEAAAGYSKDSATSNSIDINIDKGL